jgi:hypothetical protein
LRLRAPADRRVRTLDPTALAWVAVLPCALLTALVVWLLGPPLGHALLAPGSEAFWPRVDALPEPVEHGRYLLSLLGPLLLATAAVAGTRRPRQLPPAWTRAAVLATQLVLVAFLALCALAQHDVLLSANPPYVEHTVYFTWPTLAVAAALALAPLGLRRVPPGALRSALRETRTRRATCLAVAALFAAAWLLTAVVADRSIGNTNSGVAGHVLWSMDETFAILDGRTPLVNFHPEYGQLWPYVAAAVMALAGTSIGVYSLVMTSISGLALLAVYDVLRRILGRSALALALFLPFVASGFFMKLGPFENRYGPANLFSLWPIRYAGAYALAWLLARHLGGAAPRRRWPLFLAGGAVVINNPEFGAPALVATVVALACARPPRTWRAGAALLGTAAAGVLVVAALLCALTLLRAGALPRFGLLLEFSRIYAVGGWAMLPLPPLGLYFALYLTFAAAIVLAAMRAARGEQDRPLTAMLAWSGVFGLLAGSYYAGRSHPQVLVDLFSPWAFALALLAIVALRALAARGWRRPGIAQLAVLFGFALLACSIAQTPTPWSQIRRIDDTTPFPVFEQPEAKRFVAADTHRGEHVLVLIPLGHRIAYDLHLVNVSPYTSIESMPTHRQLRTTIDALRAAHGSKLFLSERFTFEEELEWLLHAGFAIKRQRADERLGALLELVDRSASRR